MGVSLWWYVTAGCFSLRAADMQACMRRQLVGTALAWYRIAL